MVVRCDEIADTTETLEIDTCLLKRLFEKTSTTERLIEQMTADGAEATRYSMEDAMMRSRLDTTFLQCGALEPESSLHTAVFRLGRANGKYA